MISLTTSKVTLAIWYANNAAIDQVISNIGIPYRLFMIPFKSIRKVINGMDFEKYRPNLITIEKSDGKIYWSGGGGGAVPASTVPCPKRVKRQVLNSQQDSLKTDKKLFGQVPRANGPRTLWPL